MKFRFLALTIAVFCLQGCISNEPKLSIDKITQKVLLGYGQETEIVKGFSELKDVSTRSDGRFSFVLEGKPGIELLLDRDYWVISSSDINSSNGVFAYMFNPKDEQSALNISIGNGIRETPDSIVAMDPGFTGISRSEGIIAKQKIVWRKWADENHMYSDSYLYIPSEKNTGRTIYKVSVQVTANTEERRAALEKSLADLKLREQ